MESYIHNTLSRLHKFEDITFEEAETSMDEIMTGKISPVLLSAWLTALSMKGESSAEIAGCAASMRNGTSGTNARISFSRATTSTISWANRDGSGTLLGTFRC